MSEPDIGAAVLMDKPIFNSRLPSLPVFFSCSRSGGGCDRCSCCNRVYCSCNAFCFRNSSWCRCSSCSCRVCPTAAGVAVVDCVVVVVGGSGMGGLPKPLPPPEITVVSDPFRLGGLSADDDTELLGDVDVAKEFAHVVGDATGDLELVRGGGGGGIRLFCRSGVRSGTGGLPVSEDVLLNRRNTGFGACVAAVTGAAAAAATAVAAIDGAVCSSSSKVSSAFSAPVGSRFPAPPSVPLPVWSTTLPCEKTKQTKNRFKRAREFVFLSRLRHCRFFLCSSLILIKELINRTP